MNITAKPIRGWSGPTILSYGFRPFFLGAALWAAMAMALWVPMLTGRLTLPTAFDPVSWHAHEFLFGYLGAVFAGFLLTAVPNWTGRPPVAGWPLGGLVALWVAGRIAVAISLHLPALAVAAIDLALIVVRVMVVGREIVAARNWRNLIVPGLLAVFAIGNAVFHWETTHGTFAAQGYGLRLGLAASLMLIAVIGGRIVPSFTRNWLVTRGPGRLPAPPMQRFDRIALFALLAALAFWVGIPGTTFTGLTLAAASVLHLARLARWAGDRALPEPLLLVLHAGYALLALGALAMAAETLAPGLYGFAAAQHVWTAGAIGLMTLAVMTRATLGHTGRDLAADAGTTLIYLALAAAVAVRLAAGIWPAQASWLHGFSGLAWIAAFGGFSVLYGPLLMRPKLQE